MALTNTTTSCDWLSKLVGAPLPVEGRSTGINGHTLWMRDGILTVDNVLSDQQTQTKEVFGFKWGKRDTFEGELSNHTAKWLAERYGDVSSWLPEHGPSPIVVDAGCGAGVPALALFGSVLDRIRFLGVDVSSAVRVAAQRFAERNLPGRFMQADLTHLPLPPDSVDIILSEGVLHHTDDTYAALAALTSHLKPGGRFMFYVYRRKGPIREFSDDYVREKLQSMSAEEGWKAMEPLTKLGKALGDLDVEVDVPEDIELLGIPAGRQNLQRLFYWHVIKAFYRPEMTLDEMNHVNYDWFAPRNARRHTEAEITEWCERLGLRIERQKVEEAGITVIAQKG